MANSATSQVVKLRNVRIAFVDLFQPRAFSPGDPEYYSVTALIEPEGQAAEVKKVKDAANAVAKEQWAEKMPRLTGKCFGDADEDGKEYDGFAGMFYIKASRRVAEGRPTVVDRDLKPLAEPDGRPYAGCYANISLTLWAQDNQYGKRINANLRAVQFVRDGDAFSGGSTVVPEDEFDVLDGDEDPF